MRPRFRPRPARRAPRARAIRVFVMLQSTWGQQGVDRALTEPRIALCRERGCRKVLPVTNGAPFSGGGEDLLTTYPSARRLVSRVNPPPLSLSQTSDGPRAYAPSPFSSVRTALPPLGPPIPREVLFCPHPSLAALRGPFRFHADRGRRTICYAVSKRRARRDAAHADGKPASRHGRESVEGEWR